ncbi:MAG: superfamily protein [Frankiales bacterium]|nr:superfamily protein [Frankiales bacterium]
MSRTRHRSALAFGVALGGLLILVAAGWADGFDTWIEDRLPPDHASGLAGITQGLSDAVILVANPRLVVPVTVVVALALAHRGRSEAVRTVIPAVVAVSVSVVLLKLALHRPGPPGSAPPQLLGWWPSGHTATNLVCAGALAALTGRRAVLGLALAWSAVVALAMVWVHAHWVSDVVGGALLGGLILLLALPAQTPTPTRHATQAA